MCRLLLIAVLPLRVFFSKSCLLCRAMQGLCSYMFLEAQRMAKVCCVISLVVASIQHAIAYEW